MLLAESNSETVKVLTLRDVFNILWKDKLLIIATVLISALLAVFFAIRLPNVYHSEALLSPNSSDNSPALGNQLGGLASLAGLNLQGNDGNKTDIAIELIQSRRFVVNFIRRYELEVALIAGQGWDAESGLKIDKSIYDLAKTTWIREVSYPFTQVPSDWELYNRFSELLSVEVEKNNGMVRVGVEYFSPYLASTWVENLVKDLNKEMRTQEIIKAQQSIRYLEKEIQNTNVASLKEVFFSLIEDQHKNKMLAEVTPDFVFTTIDPAVPTELKSAPARSFIVIAITFIAGFLSCLFVVALRTAKDG